MTQRDTLRDPRLDCNNNRLRMDRRLLELQSPQDSALRANTSQSLSKRQIVASKSSRVHTGQ